MTFCPFQNDECIQLIPECGLCYIMDDFIEDSEKDNQNENEESEIDPFDCFDEDDLLIKFSNYEELLEIDEEDLPF